jgi:hypothetical protein
MHQLSGNGRDHGEPGPRSFARMPRRRPEAAPGRRSSPFQAPPPMHYDAHQPVIDDLEARIVTIRDSL